MISEKTPQLFFDLNGTYPPLPFVLSRPVSSYSLPVIFAEHARSPPAHNPPSNIIHLAILGPSTQVLPPRLLELRASLRNMFVNGYPFLLQRLERYRLRCWKEYVCRPTYRERKYLIAEKEPRCAKTGALCFSRTRMITAQQGVVEVCLIFLWSWLIIRLFARLKVASLRRMCR